MDKAANLSGGSGAKNGVREIDGAKDRGRRGEDDSDCKHRLKQPNANADQHVHGAPPEVAYGRRYTDSRAGFPLPEIRSTGEILSQPTLTGRLSKRASRRSMVLRTLRSTCITLLLSYLYKSRAAACSYVDEPISFSPAVHFQN
jgi:hypothetical protein